MEREIGTKYAFKFVLTNCLKDSGLFNKSLGFQQTVHILPSNNRIEKAQLKYYIF